MTPTFWPTLGTSDPAVAGRSVQRSYVTVSTSEGRGRWETVIVTEPITIIHNWTAKVTEWPPKSSRSRGQNHEMKFKPLPVKDGVL